VIRLLTANLATKGYEIVTASTGSQGLQLAAQEAPDLVLLDVMLPDMDGYEVCRRLREFSDVPVLMLTAKAREADKLSGFGSGADDYITKPFSVRELLARVAVALRRSSGAVAREPVVTAGRITVDLGARRTFLAGEPVDLTATEYGLLAHLAANKGKVLLHEQILRHVWGPEYSDSVDYLRVYVSHLRRKLGDRQGRVLRTVTGVGYMLDDPDDREA
jgi:two-component system, OmpR family, KDP operon response regulator KdpE